MNPPSAALSWVKALVRVIEIIHAHQGNWEHGLHYLAWQSVTSCGMLSQNFSQPASSFGFSAGLAARRGDSFAVSRRGAAGLFAGSCNLNT